MGSCHRIPGTDYHEYEVQGDRVPSEKEADSTCKNCFKQGFIFLGGEAELSEAESISSSSSSSSSGWPPPLPRKGPDARGHNFDSPTPPSTA